MYRFGEAIGEMRTNGIGCAGMGSAPDDAVDLGVLWGGRLSVLRSSASVGQELRQDEVRYIFVGPIAHMGGDGVDRVEVEDTPKPQSSRQWLLNSRQ